MKDKTSECVINILKARFGRHGIPKEIVADNNLFSSNKCREFSRVEF